jgi:hypothetical protein
MERGGKMDDEFNPCSPLVLLGAARKRFKLTVLPTVPYTVTHPCFDIHKMFYCPFGIQQQTILRSIEILFTY